MYKEDLTLNDLQRLIYHKTQSNPTKPYYYYYYIINMINNNTHFLKIYSYFNSGKKTKIFLLSNHPTSRSSLLFSF